MLARSNVSPALEIRLFGRFAVSVRGQPVDEKRWERRSAKALVKLLSMSPPHAMHREQLVETLWPELSAPAGINSLNKAIHAARRALEPGLSQGGQSSFILTPTDQVVLSSPGGLQVDMHLFEQAAQRAMQDRDVQAARRALALYGGELLIDDLYEPWTFARREWSRRLFRSTSIEAARLLAQAGEPAQAITLAQRLLLEDAADEPVHTLLVQLYVSCGRLDEALRQAAQARRSLEATGISPSPSFLSLEKALRGAGETAPLVGNPAPAGGAKLPSDIEPDGGADDEWSMEAVPVAVQAGAIRTVRVAAPGAQVLVNSDRGSGPRGLTRQGLDGEAGQSLPWPGAALFGASPNGLLALGLNPRFRNPWIEICTLVVATADGGHSTELLQGVCGADWHPRSAALSLATGAPTGQLTDQLTGELAVAREVDGKAVVEYPIGVRRFQSAGWVSHLRCSPCGHWLAFLNHPIENDDEGDVVLVDLQATGTQANAVAESPSRVLAHGFASVQGLVWFNGFLWFTATRGPAPRALWQVDLQGVARRMLQEPRVLTLHDAVPGRGLLVTVDRQSVKTMVQGAGEAEARDISWHELTWPRDISGDGQWLLVEELQVAGRQRCAAYLRKTDGTATRKVADGVPLVLSPDGTRAIIRQPTDTGRLAELDLASSQLTLLPVGEDPPLTFSEFVSYFPDGRRIAFVAGDKQEGTGVYVQDLPAGTPVRFGSAAPGVRKLWNRAVSPDGRNLLLLGPEGLLWMYPTDGGAATPLTALGPGFLLIGWHSSGEEIFVQQWPAEATHVVRFHLGTGVLTPWKTLSPVQAGAARSVRRLRMTADGLTFAFGLESTLSDLYLIQKVVAPTVAEGPSSPGLTALAA